MRSRNAPSSSPLRCIASALTMWRARSARTIPQANGSSQVPERRLTCCPCSATQTRRSSNAALSLAAAGGGSRYLFDAIVFPSKSRRQDSLRVNASSRSHDSSPQAICLVLGEQRFDSRPDFGLGELGGDADAVHDGALVG